MEGFRDSQKVRNHYFELIKFRTKSEWPESKETAKNEKGCAGRRDSAARP